MTLEEFNRSLPVAVFAAHVRFDAPATAEDA
jgi:hypothetical protein